MGLLIRILGSIFQKALNISKIESFVAVTTIFLGQNEIPAIVKPFIDRMNRNELFTAICSGMASIAGSMMIGYKPPVALLTIRVILQWHQMPFYNRHSSRNHALSPYTSATAYFPATTFWCLPDIFTAHFETTNGTICNPRTTCKATPHE